MATIHVDERDLEWNKHMPLVGNPSEGLVPLTFEQWKMGTRASATRCPSGKGAEPDDGRQRALRHLPVRIVMIFDLVLLAVFAGYTASFVCLVLERASEGRRPDGRSACVCGTPIPMYRNIPVASWLLQRGSASCCAAPIPVWYVVAESAAVAAAVGGGLATGKHPWWGGLAGTLAALVGLWWWDSVGHRAPPTS